LRAGTINASEEGCEGAEIWAGRTLCLGESGGGSDGGHVSHRVAPQRGASADETRRGITTQLLSLTDEVGVQLVEAALRLRERARDEGDEDEPGGLSVLCEQLRSGGLRALLNVFKCALHGAEEDMSSANTTRTQGVVCAALLYAVEMCADSEHDTLLVFRDQAIQETLLGLALLPDPHVKMTALQVLARLASWPGVPTDFLLSTDVLCCIGAQVGSSLAAAEGPQLIRLLELLQALLHLRGDVILSAPDRILSQQLKPMLDAVGQAVHNSSAPERKIADRLRLELG